MLHKDEKWIRWNPLNISDCQAFSVDITQDENGTEFAVECEDMFVLYPYENMF